MNDMRRQTLRLADGGGPIARWADNVAKPTQGRQRQADSPGPVSLGFADGGMFGGLKRTLGMAPSETVTQKFARQDAERAAKAAKNAPPPALTPAPVPGAGISGYSGNGALEGRMKAAGLRDGGTPYHEGSLDGGRVVGPGTTISDSVPARYSKDEYVLPADTAKAIGHDNLDAIKDATHVPAAVQRGYDLQSQGDRDGQEDTQRGGTVPGRTSLREGASLRGVAEVDGRMDRGGDYDSVSGQRDLRGPAGTQSNRVTPRGLRLADGGIPGLSVTERPWAGSADSRLFAQQPGAGNPNIGPDGSSQARAFRATQGVGVGPQTPGGWSAPPETARAAPQAARTGGLRGAAQAAGNFVTGPGSSGGSVGGAFKNVLTPLGSAAKSSLRAAGKLVAPAGAGMAIAGGFSTDTEDYAKRFGLENTEPGFLRDTGVRAAGVAGDSLGLKGTDTETYAKRFGLEKTEPGFLRDLGVRALGVGSDIASFGQASRLDGLSPAAASAPQPPKAPSLRDGAFPTQAAATAPGQDATMPGQDPGRVTLRGMAGADVDGAPGVSKFTQNGKTLYSNVPGADNDKLMSNNPGVSTVPGMSRAQIDQTLTNPDGSRWSAGDNAIMAANLRDGADAYRGTSRDERNNPEFRLEQLAASPLGTPGRAFAQKQLGLRMADSTTRRGQDMAYEDKLQGRQQAAEAAQSSSRAEQQNKDRTYDLDVQKFGVEEANKSRDDKRAGEKAFDDRVSGFVGTDKDGKPDARAASAVRNASNVFLASKQAEAEAALKKDPGNKRAAAILDDILTNGVGGIDDATLRTILLGQKANTVAQEYDGMSLNPWAGKATNTQAPVTSLRLQDNMILPNQYVTDNGQLIPRRAVEDNPDLQKLIRLRQQ